MACGEYFFKGVKKGFTGKSYFEQRPERSKGASHVNGWIVMGGMQAEQKASESMLEISKVEQGGQPAWLGWSKKNGK